MSDKPDINTIRHSTAHLLAAAIHQLYPEAKFGVGPVVDNGFYYDIDLGDNNLSTADFTRIEKIMRQMIKKNIPYIREELALDKAIKFFQKIKQPFKVELLKDLKNKGTTAVDGEAEPLKADEPVSIYHSGDFVDLCRGPHVNSSSQLGIFKLTKVAGAYWRGDDNNSMLTRIYGVAFTRQKELDDYLLMMEEAQKRDHRKLGKELDLFTFSEMVGSGLPLYTPKGTWLRLALTNYIEEIQTRHNYTQVWTPQLAKAKLFQTSGHYDKYKDDMFQVISNYSKEEFFLKPMNCPQHTQIYASQPRSYRDLPLRYTDFAMLYRDEKPGELNGLARVRSFSQDDCHVFCREDQVDKEIDIALSMIKEVLKTFGFTYRYRLSTRDPQHPEKYLGDPKTWDKVEKWAVKIMKRNEIDYYDGPGEAAFYAPKMDLMATDALGREWQLSTVQIDYVMPERFNLEYTDSDGQKKRPIMLHRAIIGSPERFLMILIEHYAGAFPVWLAPTQISLLPVGNDHIEYCQKLAARWQADKFRITIDDANETIGNKIRKAAAAKIPYVLVIGDKEIKSDKLQVRLRDKRELLSITEADFRQRVQREMSGRRDLS
ncbi:MAG: threonine--tRNA ligase [Candidatus Komeilibacteria bacterium]